MDRCNPDGGVSAKFGGLGKQGLDHSSGTSLFSVHEWHVQYLKCGKGIEQPLDRASTRHPATLGWHPATRPVCATIQTNIQS